MKFALVGSPNSGKTTLFNALTGSRQRTGNYAGVTVERKEGILTANSTTVTLIDLPGTYSLNAKTPDETITLEIVTGARSDQPRPDAIIAVADSTSIERNLYLVLQLRELGIPMILALTMSDLAEKTGVSVDKAALQRRLGIPVILTSALKRSGLEALTTEVLRIACARPQLNSTRSLNIDNSSAKIIERYKTIEETVRETVHANNTARDVSDITMALDRLLLHRTWGPVILLFLFTAMFQAIFSLAHAPMHWIEQAIGAFQQLARHFIPGGAAQSLVVDGIIAGVGSVLAFLPQIVLLFLFILAIEDSGYMARAAFIMDRIMGKIGLQGRSFIPLLSCFGCAVPGIMATRTIESRRDRLITILIAPLMTCSARLPIYTLMIAAFIPPTKVLGVLTLQGLALPCLYVFGVIAAMLMAFILRRTVFRGENSSFLMELPAYKLPTIRNLALGIWSRVVVFLRRAGTVILAAAVISWFLASFPRTQPPSALDGPQAAAYRLEHSFAGRAGKFMEPLIRPLGYDWRIGIGVLSSFAAREMLLSTLGTVYAIGNPGEATKNTTLVARLRSDPTFSVATASSLLVFYALACQCVSTLAVTRRETNSWRWPAVMFGYLTAFAFISAFLTYRIVSFLMI